MTEYNVKKDKQHMCGILFAKSLDGKPVNRIIAEQFENQKGRGTEGFGVVLEKPDKTIDVLRSTEIVKFLIDLHPKFDASPMIMAHHRTPTSSPNLTGQTHPILVSNELLKYDYLIEHNGIINNADERKKDHELMDFKYTTSIMTGYNTNIEKFNDSESLAIDLACYIEQLVDKVKARGSAAFVGLQIDKTTKQPHALFFGRNYGNPLKYSRDQKLIMISSEGKGEMVETDTITFIYLDNPKLKQKTYKLEVEYSYQQTSRVFDSKGNKQEDKKEDSKSGTAVPVNASSTNREADDDYAYQGRGSQHYDADDAPDVIAEGETGESDEDTAIAARIAEIETDLEDRLGLFMDCLVEAAAIDDAEACITNFVEAMHDAVEEMKAVYETARQAQEDKELDEQFARSVAKE